ncbi:tetratricopeptide repeat protein 36-like [Corticium candelabrum]|uniref:tetratricopeptide repeat protein 36-like n=1 Tax=Corticium candelabrum TaxID=121492 RepID=UPI002E273D0F|nr:tetratricopeptide repeat protein 36-like [Corticium candelabrum]
MTDELVLHHIFNPNDPFSAVEQLEECLAASDSRTSSDEGLENLVEAKMLELEGVKSAEAGEIDTAIRKLNKTITICPGYASAYNNRAQALQLQGDVDGALSDLNVAIQLSEGEGEVAKQAYTQRAIVRKMRGDDDNAVCDFQKAANLGSSFAKSQLVRMNPYAAMCNKMLSEAIGKLQSGRV